ncbi:MAG: toll/interleukin-1 receptor domain-containing protein [candidate division KSB1 bacterium]|nr:toll/interleukin-1 receptor domain-containing protein [candidate division KSB1 bacterium]MDZ7304629.1 toll/interleukin-1 receptor domain-containing protein [candidate division KSB1 bacterium]MDZ7313761.1 toll/interleukin-1 receptor domain-containing protein [candidate division KSB1 bacterium]
MRTKPRIFICYAKEDEEKVRALHQKLSEVGFKPWMDQKDILPGEAWEDATKSAILSSDFFLVCLSKKSINKRGFLQREIKNALEVWQEKLSSDIYLIPVRLEDCAVPDNLRKFQWVNWFDRDGFARLQNAIQSGMARRKKIIKNTTANHSKAIKPGAARGIPSTAGKGTKSQTRHEKGKTTFRKSLSKRASKMHVQKKKQIKSQKNRGSTANNEDSNHRTKIANPNILIEEDQMWVCVHKEKRIVTHHYRFKALKDLTQYRFKFLWSGSGEVRLSCKAAPNDILLSNPEPEPTGIEWQKRTLLFAEPLKKGEQKQVTLTYEILDEHQGDFPYQNISYAHTAGCLELVVHLLFSEPPFPSTVQLIKYDYNKVIISHKIIQTGFDTMTSGKCMYTALIETKPGVKYRIEWKVPEPA